MIEQAAIAGHRLEPLLSPHVDDVVRYRDYLGQVRPGNAPLTAAAVASVGQDYGLDRAEVRAGGGTRRAGTVRRRRPDGSAPLRHA